MELCVSFLFPYHISSLLKMYSFVFCGYYITSRVYIILASLGLGFSLMLMVELTTWLCRRVVIGVILITLNIRISFWWLRHSNGKGIFSGPSETSDFRSMNLNMPQDEYSSYEWSPNRSVYSTRHWSFPRALYNVNQYLVKKQTPKSEEESHSLYLSIS